MSDYLTAVEIDELRQCEIVIEHGLKTFIEVGNALMEIRDKRLYRIEYSTFEEYCQKRWDLTRRYIDRLINAAMVVDNIVDQQRNAVSNNETNWSQNTVPINEAQARPLTNLTPEGQAAVWQTVINTAPNGKVTAQHVQNVVEDFNYKRDSRQATDQNIYVPKGMDACQTPAYAIDPLLSYITQFDIVWEPAAGEGYLVEALYDSGWSADKVEASDLIEGQNFFEYEPEQWDCLVTNPPYSLKFKWLERCYDLEKPFALLLPVETLGTKSAQLLFRDFGLELIVLDRRINFKMPNKGWESHAQFPVAWFTYGLGIGHQIVFGHIE